MIDITNYDEDNVFAKILRNEIPSKKVFENDFVYAFEDINPQAPIHILIIPKSKYCSFNDFSENAENNSIGDIVRSINKIVKLLKLEDGYRIITNVGSHGCQEVPHLHFHLLSGKQIGRLVVT